MTGKTVRIGAGSAFCFDSGLSVPQMLRQDPPDYLVFEHLAEGAMALFFQMQRMSPELGYSTTIIDTHVGPYLAELMAAKVRIVTNAGGLNPHGAARALATRAAQLGLSPKIAVVDGDDLRPALDDLAAGGFREMFSGEEWPDGIVAANAYLGGFPIAKALDMGADIVITGRVVDSALTLGPLIHEFGWTQTDYDALAAGTAAGHLLECGTQATGGTFTDWLDLPTVDDFGFPIAECSADGSFIITKPANTGGLASVGTVSEQLLYEVSDPAAYLVPDVTCDFTATRIEQVGEDRVKVSGVKGKAPSGCYKVCALVEDGWRAMQLIPVMGDRAVEKAKRMTDAVLKRTAQLYEIAGIGPWKAVQVDHFGSGDTFAVAPASNATQTEVTCRIVLIHEEERGATVFRNEAIAVGTNGCPGNISMGGVASISPVQRLYSFLLPRDRLSIAVTMGDRRKDMRETGDPAPHVHYDAPAAIGAADGGGAHKVPLVTLAWGRSGDKGNLYNIGVIARRPEYLPYIRGALSARTVGDWMRHTFDDPDGVEVRAYDVPGMHALNFVVDRGLAGGASVGLRIDSNAKGMAQKLLQMPVSIPSALLPG